MRLFRRKSEQKGLLKPQHAAVVLVELCEERRKACSEEMSQHRLTLTLEQQQAFDEHIFMTNVAFVVHWLGIMQREANEPKIAQEILMHFEAIKCSDLNQQQLLEVSAYCRLLAEQIRELPLPTGPLTPENGVPWDVDSWCAQWLTAVPQRRAERDMVSRYGMLLIPHLRKSKEMFKSYVESAFYTTGAFTAYC